VHLFLLWPTALPEADRILADVERGFRIHELIRLRWSRQLFGENLRRFYGPQLPPGVDKLAETGTGDLLLAVVSDPAPKYRLRPRTTGRERVNASVFDAKQRYREWTGGLHLVHATNDRAEAERDIFLLLGRTVASVRPAEGGRRPPVQTVEADLIGAHGWSSFDELLTAMEHSGGYALLNPGSPGPPVLLTHEEWAVEILKARPAREAGGLYETIVGGDPFALEIWWVGDGRLPADRQAAILNDVTRTNGVLAASAADQEYVKLSRRRGRG
jgi:hypothetical protein